VKSSGKADLGLVRFSTYQAPIRNRDRFGFVGNTLTIVGPIILVVILVVVALAVLILWLRDKFWERRLKAWRQRMLNPNPGEVESLCGGLLPQMLVSMYNDKELISHDRFGIYPSQKNAEGSVLWIEDFVPLTAQDQKRTCQSNDFGMGCCFAEDGAGNFFWVPVNESRQIDAPVFLTGPDFRSSLRVADSLYEFLHWPRSLVQK
jgi:hypothetical protein